MPTPNRHDPRFRRGDMALRHDGAVGITSRPVIPFRADAREPWLFVVESESFLFPGTGAGGFGVFVGGTDS